MHLDLAFVAAGSDGASARIASAEVHQTNLLPPSGVLRAPQGVVLAGAPRGCCALGHGLSAALRAWRGNRSGRRRARWTAVRSSVAASGARRERASERGRSQGQPEREGGPCGGRPRWWDLVRQVPAYSPSPSCPRVCTGSATAVSAPRTVPAARGAPAGTAAADTTVLGAARTVASAAT